MIKNTYLIKKDFNKKKKQNKNIQHLLISTFRTSCQISFIHSQIHIRYYDGIGGNEEN